MARRIVSVVYFIVLSVCDITVEPAASRPIISCSRYHLESKLKKIANDVIEEHCKKKRKHSTLFV